MFPNLFPLHWWWVLLVQEMNNVGEVHLVNDKNPLVPGDCSSSGRKRIYMAGGPRRGRGGWENDAVRLKRKIKEVSWCQGKIDAISNQSRAWIAIGIAHLNTWSSWTWLMQSMLTDPDPIQCLFPAISLLRSTRQVTSTYCLQWSKTLTPWP